MNPTPETHPYGTCECRDQCPCKHGPGPAAYKVTRPGISGPVRVCTKCFTIGDKDVQILVTGDLTLFATYDPLGVRLLRRLRQPRRAT